MSIPWYRKLLYSLLTTSAFFLALELGLAIVGVRPVTESKDPFVGFSSDIPLFVPLDDDPQVLTTAANKTPWFNPQTFRRNKAEGTYRIFCVGGSTTFGRPYRDPTSYSGWLRDYLGEADPGKKWEVINAGGVSYASYRVAAVMEELTEYEPDLFIVYTAQNEFLEWRTYDDMLTRSKIGMSIASKLSQTRTWSVVERATRGLRTPPEDTDSKRFELPGEVDEILNHTIGPSSYQRNEVWRSQVISHYEKNLQRMVAIARNAGAKIVFVTPASNLKDCSPFRSDATEELPAKKADLFFTHIAMAEEHSTQGDVAGELREYKMARDVDDKQALLHYRIGRALFALKRYDEAEEAFELAIENDICPLRAVDDIVSAIRRTSKLRNVPLVDFQAKLRQHCLKTYGHSCLGNELFLDHVHPKIEGHRLLGEWLFEAMQEQGIVSASAELSEEVKQSVAARIANGIDSFERGVALRNLSKVLHWAGKFEEAGPIALQALEFIENDFASLVVAADCLRETGDGEAAIPLYQEILDQDVTYYAAHMRLGQLLAARGELENAKHLLTTGLSIEPDVAFAQYELGLIHIAMKEYSQAIKALNESQRLAPLDVDTMYFLGKAHVGDGNQKAAEQWFRAAVELAPGDVQALNELGLVLINQNKRSEAIKQFDAALALDPSFEEAAINRRRAAEVQQTQDP